MDWIDLSADLGEGCPGDEALLRYVSSASISCGAHAGDDLAIAATLRMARANGVVAGAHPGFPDRGGFGRRERPTTREEAAEIVRSQVLHLCKLADAEGVAIRFVKPHGALYNQAQRDPEIARGLIDAIVSLRIKGLTAVGLPDCEVERAAVGAGVAFLAEGFADRGYREDGRLIARGEPGAILESPSAISEQVVRLARGGRVRTLCVHGDDPLAVAHAVLVRHALGQAGIAVRAFAP